MRILLLAACMLFTPAMFAQSGIWVQETSNPPWLGRHMQRTVTFNNQIWMIGGYTNTYLSEIWTSSDGANWTPVIPSGPIWSARRAHGLEVFNNRLWVIGGADGTALNDVWSSADGISWTLEQPTAQWGGRSSFATAVFDNKLWILGGYVGNTGINEVWSSPDGVTWTQSPAPPWPGRYHHTAAVFDNKLWVLGGLGGGNDVWHSTNGSSWTQATTPPWPARYGFIAEVFDDRIWVMAGSWGLTSYNDGWSSSDGNNWTQEWVTASWSGRRYPTSGVLNNRIWLVTGYDGSANVDDAWTYEGPPLIESTPPPTATVGVLYTYDVVASGYPAPTIDATGLPGWLTRVGNQLSGTPGPGDIGLTGSISVTATNTSGVDTQMFQIDVEGVPPLITSAPVTLATVGSMYSYTVTASGIPAPAFSAGTLPAWLSFNSTTAELSGTPTAADLGLSAPIDITADNGWPPNDVQSFQIDVQGIPPTITSTPPSSVTVGDLYSYTIVADGTPAPAFSANTMPGWLTLTGNVLSGTPQAADLGMNNVEITASNGYAPDDVQSFQIEVEGIPPTFTSTPEASAVPTRLYTYTATADGIPAPTLSAGTLPSWLTFNAATGVLSGTPPGSAQNTSVDVTLTASNNYSPDATQMFTIQIGRTPGADVGSGGSDGGCALGGSGAGGLLLLALMLTRQARRRRHAS